MILRDVIDEKVIADTLRGYHRPSQDLNPKVIVDLGCHIGTTMLDLHTLYPGAFVVGVEMDFDNARFARLVTQMPVVWAAISDVDGEALYGGEESWAYRLGQGHKWCPSITLASLYDKIGLESVDYLKVDIEGTEECLFSSVGWAGRTTYLKAEIHSPYTVERAISDLQRLGFEARADTSHWACVEAWH